MIRSNNMRPAYATCGSVGQTSSPSKNRSMLFSVNSNTDEFNEFNSFDSSPRYHGKSQPRKNSSYDNRRDNRFSPTMVVAAVAIVAVLLLAIIIISAIASAGSKGIRFDNNSYTVYEDADGNTFISVNGKPIDASFEGSVTLHEAKDRSFAYIEEVFDKEYNIYILEGKTMTSVTMSPATDILAYADYEPGVIYKDGNDVFLFTLEHGEELITDDQTAKNFKLSGDGRTVAFNQTDLENGNKINLLMFNAGKSTQKVASSCFPAAVSFDGSYIYIYGYTKTDRQKKLYVVDTDDFEKQQVGPGIFGDIIAMNAKGDEIIYYTTATTENGSTETTSHLYSVKKEKSCTIAKGFFVPAVIDIEIACPASFKDSYLQSASSTAEGSTYYIDRKFTPTKVATFVGSFSPDGDYFYYTNEEDYLVQIDLNDDNYSSTRILSDVEDYVITRKGNLYILDSDNVLRFYDVDDSKKIKISENAKEMVMYDYSNVLYFIEEDSVTVLSTKEGSTKDTVKFDKASLSGLPIFKYSNSEITYAFTYDEDIGWKIFYTSNGRRFSLVTSECKNIDDGIYE